MRLLSRIARALGRRRTLAPSRREGRRPSAEGLEARTLLDGAAADLAALSAATADSRSVTLTYAVDAATAAPDFAIGVYRSADATFDPGDLAVADARATSSTLDDAGRPAVAPGTHALTIPIPGGLPPDPSRPFTLAVIDPAGAVADANRADDVASFRTYLLGAVTHGGFQDTHAHRPPGWALRMAKRLAADGYDEAFAFNWSSKSATPGKAAKQGHRLARVLLRRADHFPAGAPVDLHLIGHSEGTVVNSVALKDLQRHLSPALARGYVKLTMLDPHAANNAAPGAGYSASSGFLGGLARTLIRNYQGQARDPLVSVPSFVDDAEVFYQHNPIGSSHANSGIYNLWGQVPVKGKAHYFQIVGGPISHSGRTGVQVWYNHNIVPSLRDNASPTDPLTIDAHLAPGQVATTTRRGRPVVAGSSPSFEGTAAPGATVELLAGRALSGRPRPVARTVAAPDGSWSLDSRPLGPGRYRFVARSNAPSASTFLRRHLVPTAPIGMIVVRPGRGGPASQIRPSS